MNAVFLERYAGAREEQADKLFREIIEIADDASGDYVTTSDGQTIVDHENIQRSQPCAGFLYMYARVCVMGSYSESEKASQHREMPSNAVAALLLSGRDRPSF